MFKTMLTISGCVENMLKISRLVEKYSMCRKLCWNSMLKISACVENCKACWKLYQNFKRCVENVYVRHVENHIKTVLKYEKNTITLYGMCWNWAADFIFLLRFCTRNWSETYANTSKWFTYTLWKVLSCISIKITSLFWRNTCPLCTKWKTAELSPNDTRANVFRLANPGSAFHVRDMWTAFKIYTIFIDKLLETRLRCQISWHIVSYLTFIFL